MEPVGYKFYQISTANEMLARVSFYAGERLFIRELDFLNRGTIDVSF